MYNTVFLKYDSVHYSVFLLNCVPLFAAPWTLACQTLLSLGFPKAIILEWVSISFSRGSSWPRDWAQVSCISCSGRRILYQLLHLGSHIWQCGHHQKFIFHLSTYSGPLYPFHSLPVSPSNYYCYCILCIYMFGLFIFYLFTCFLYPNISEIIQCLSFSILLISLGVIHSKSIHVVSKSKISFFMLE